MSDEEDNDVLLIPKYKVDTMALLAKTVAANLPRSPLEVPCIDGVFTVNFPADAKPVSSFGGPSKVFGKSEISIPRYKLRKD